jgi:hypothetical protein
MRTLLLLFIPYLAFAGGPKYGHEPAKLDDEIRNIYHDIRNTGGDIDDPLTIGSIIVSTITASSATITNLTVSGSARIKGTTTNDSAAAGDIGEYVSANINSNTAFPTSGAFGDLTSISLTAGNWLVTSVVRCNSLTSTTMTGFEIGISLVTGNSSTGLTATENYVSLTFPTTGHGINEAFMSIAVPPVILRSSSTATVYLKYTATYTGTAPGANGSIRAIRVR